MNKKIIKINHTLIGLLIIAQIFIVMFQATIVRDVQLFGLSVFEGFNIVISLISMCLTIYAYSEKKKFFKYIPYAIILGAYFILHGYHIYQFNEAVYASQEPSFLVESYYIFRTFIVPLLLIFNIYYSGMKKEQLIKILEIFVFIIAIVMVATNLFGIAQRNYSEETVYATLKLFDWFSFDNISKYSYYQLTTKGWFLSGNQMAAILFMLFPIIVYRAYKVRDWFHYVLMCMQILAMFMLGTKVANIGCLLIALMFACFWIFFKLIKHKESGIIAILIISMVFCMLFPFSPVGYMIRYQNKHQGTGSEGRAELMLDRALEVDLEDDTEMDEDEKLYYENLKKDSKIFKKLNPDELSDDEKKFVLKYMSDYCGYFGISPFIIENYDDLEHSVFWARYMQETPNNDYRVLKNMILEDIYNNNDNPLDKYFGMGYTLNYIYTEADYTYQVYIYGILGVVVLIGPYFCLLAYVILQGLRNFKKMFTLESAICFAAPLLGLCVAKFSGHVLERSFPLITLSMVLGIILLHTRNCVKTSED